MTALIIVLCAVALSWPAAFAAGVDSVEVTSAKVTVVTKTSVDGKIVDTTLVFVRGQRLKYEGFSKNTSGFECSVAGITRPFDIPLYHARVVLNTEAPTTGTSTVRQVQTTDRQETDKGKSEPPKPTAEKPAPKEEDSGGQCKAITKKGTRCSRRATSGGTCWQH